MHKLSLIHSLILAAIFALIFSASAHAMAFAGVNHSPLDAVDVEQRMTQLENNGVQSLRIGIYWAEIEKSPGQFDFEKYDKIILSAALHHIEVLPIIFSTPDWASSNSIHPQDRVDSAPPKSPGLIVPFVQQLVSRYGTNGSLWFGVPTSIRVHSWQAWNEPNLSYFWGGQRANVSNYVALARIIAQTIHSQESRASVISAGLPYLARPNDPLSWLRGYVKYGLFHDLDGFSMHPFATTDKGVIKAVADARSLMNHYHLNRKQLWITEFGWPTGTPSRNNGYSLWKTERVQAQLTDRLMKGFLSNRRRLNITHIFIYQWQDGPKTLAPWGYHMGLERENGQPKPALGIYSHYLQLHL